MIIRSIISASVIAFFAYVGFDDVVNIAEETVNPHKIMPLAIGITLVLVTLLYVLITIVAIDTLPMAELANSRAPVGLLFERLTGMSPLTITLIAIFATLNGVVIQIIMASRVLYGLGRKGHIPPVFARISPATQTPLTATGILIGFILMLVVFVPLDRLAEWTSQINLSVFFLVNISLVAVKLRREPAPAGIFTVPIIVPILGAITCAGLLTGSLLL